MVNLNQQVMIEITIDHLPQVSNKYIFLNSLNTFLTYEKFFFTDIQIEDGGRTH